MTITTTQLSWPKIGLFVAGVAVVGTGIWSLTHNDPAPPQPKQRVQSTVQTQPIVPTYDKPSQTQTAQAAMLRPALPTDASSTASQKPGTQQQRHGAAKPR